MILELVSWALLDILIPIYIFLLTIYLAAD